MPSCARRLTRLMALVLALSAALPALADSYWTHNGSLMRLVAHGAARSFYYVVPRQGIVAAGVRPGTLFFDGWRDGDRYRGTARVFAASCGASSFHIEGWVASETHVVLEGWRPVFHDCHPTGGQTWERLEFIYSHSD